MLERRVINLAICPRRDISCAGPPQAEKCGDASPRPPPIGAHGVITVTVL